MADKKKRTTKASKAPKENLRLVIRRLPPKLPEEIMMRLLAPYQQFFSNFYFVVGDPTLEKNCFARAYVKFNNRDAMLHFARGFDGHLFKGQDGSEHRARVECAPFADVPPKKAPDPLQGTIEDDPDYKRFLEERDAKPEALPSAEEWLKEHEAQLAELADPADATPLQAFVGLKLEEKAKAKRAERRSKAKAKDKVKASKASANTHHDKETKKKMWTTTDKAQVSFAERVSASKKAAAEQAKTKAKGNSSHSGSGSKKSNVSLPPPTPTPTKILTKPSSARNASASDKSKSKQEGPSAPASNTPGQLVLPAPTAQAPTQSSRPAAGAGANNKRDEASTDKSRGRRQKRPDRATYKPPSERHAARLAAEGAGDAAPKAPGGRGSGSGGRGGGRRGGRSRGSAA
ncbi:uncharacterized protein MONBRDRAFT_38659 [Monosiga brevicollis MX1]|uniref:UPF3 domain-containing protein n=1 Tax=Monosiga brevicollis TaxID=81824 RepID=A9V998_MONBE|nr:uncharacterized protein MONBRDRAFT_38659 [Monosiga brevicollis MX1]EDQ85824.1 predicted protein [Monosiga brevicollis MX1]|eukprot:XP_001749303.1 hypothetical protein [Monosiga brevicollis MX1]